MTNALAHDEYGFPIVRRRTSPDDTAVSKEPEVLPYPLWNVSADFRVVFSLIPQIIISAMDVSSGRTLLVMFPPMM